MNPLKKLETLRNQFNPQNAMLGAMKTMLPQLGESLKAMEKPVKEGGVLEEGEERVAILVLQREGEPTLAICTIKQMEGGMLLSRTLSNQPLEEIFTNEGA